MPTTMRYAISLELHGAIGDSYKQLRHTLNEDLQATEALKGLWVFNWGKRTPYRPHSVQDHAFPGR